MNNLTRKIKVKGYTLDEGLKALGISISTFRRMQEESHLNHNDLKVWVDELPNKSTKEGES